MASVWPKLPRYKQHFDRNQPLFRLSATCSNGAQFMGKIGPVSGDNLLELACDLAQVSAANDDSLYTSTVYPCCKITQDVDATNTTGNPGTGNRATIRRALQRQRRENGRS
jgi:hypothetical protein